MRSLSSYITGVKHPEGFHGEGKTKNFFEGWYFKFVSRDQSQRWAVIPGIFRGLGGESRDEAFVQVLDGSTGRSWYHVFPSKNLGRAPKASMFTSDQITSAPKVRLLTCLS